MFALFRLYFTFLLTLLNLFTPSVLLQPLLVLLKPLSVLKSHFLFIYKPFPALHYTLPVSHYTLAFYFSYDTLKPNLFVRADKLIRFRTYIYIIFYQFTCFGKRAAGVSLNLLFKIVSSSKPLFPREICSFCFTVVFLNLCFMYWFTLTFTYFVEKFCILSNYGLFFFHVRIRLLTNNFIL